MSTPPTFLSDWARLWQLAERVASRTREEPDHVFMPVGLRLQDPAQARGWDYDSTPINVTTFASTGGDGVHFSVVNVNDGNGVWPVVMTVPMAFDCPNTIVGGDLREFLALGCRTGYLYLERLAYGWGRQASIAGLEAGTPPEDAEEAVLLRHLGEEFDLRPWRNVHGRLGELDAAHRPSLQLRPGA
ncbi:hypothetical protein KZZ52_55580 [Dactylosporangium sp. AC04546]|uniref:hypothetical protein n=1 Tax=Dactylosporangium sp. AC04546 TaxID=2862460 RepID=UPI001EDCF589|nr:hypothetical protein [Dactylosporangium sp. AC04546]WVK83049.1 hypothetical protein KZZ52_55580 [Dactylosporangium sp. AC04546]